MNKLYYIRNKGFVGNCWLFWREKGQGYTCDLNDAGKFTEEEARKICKSRPEADTMYLVEWIDKFAVRHFRGL